MAGIFLDSSSISHIDVDEAFRYNIQQNNIRFEFPDGFSELRLIEECRAINALDVTDPDNFDFMFDITMQMLTGKTVFVYYLDELGNKTEMGRFHVTNRMMNLRNVDIIDEYPILVNWLVEFIAGTLGKKYPRSLKDFQAKMSEREERMKSLKSQEAMRTSFQHK